MSSSQDAYEYGHENVGVLLTSDRRAHEYGHENVGLAAVGPQGGYEYGHYGDVDTSIPTPYIWILRPTSGRALDAVEVVGFGFGDSAAMYTGTVEALQSGVWVTVSVVSWARLAATGNAYTGARQITPEVIDPEHEVITITVPSWALPPDVQLRVRTNA